MNESDYIFAAKYVLGVIESKDIVGFADRKLAEGHYSDSYLEIVDAELKTWPVLSPLLEVALKDLGLTIPDFEQATWVMLKHHIGLIADGTVNPKDQFSQLLNDIESFDLTKGITKYVGDNVGIDTMYGWYYEDYASEHSINIELKSESIKWVALHSQKH